MRPLREFARHLPLTVKVPLVVVLLMLAIGVAASERVLARLVQSQQRQLGDLANTYLDGLAASLVDPVLRGDPWEVFDILDQARRSYASVTPVETVVTDQAGGVLAASNPRRWPIGARFAPAEPAAGLDGGIVVDEARSLAFASRDLLAEGHAIGGLHAELDISPLLSERREVLWTLVASNAVLTLLFAGLGWFAVSRLVAPVNVLAEHLDSAQDGAVRPIEEARISEAGAETGRLFRRFNGMARAVAEREALLSRLADEERLASLGRLASGMAHEINNPLGGMLNAVDTIRTHGDRPEVRHASLDLLERGLRGMREVVGSVLATYRPDRSPRQLAATDLDDLRLLIGPEVRRRGLQVAWRNRLPPGIPVPAFPVRQLALNLLLNACRAAPESGSIGLTAGAEGGVLTVAVEDSGPGLPDHLRTSLSLDGARPVTDAAGLGLWISRRLADEVGGRIAAAVSAGGTRITLTVPYPVAATRELADVA
jgi:signal transduction histidine kinase